MASTYIHLSGRDIDNAVLGMYGMGEKNKKEILNGLPVKCYRCGFSNDPDTKFCSNCGLPLDTKTAIEEEKRIETLDNLSTEALKKDNVREAFKEAIKELIKENPDLLWG